MCRGDAGPHCNQGGRSSVCVDASAVSPGQTFGFWVRREPPVRPGCCSEKAPVYWRSVLSVTALSWVLRPADGHSLPERLWFG